MKHVGRGVEPDSKAEKNWAVAPPRLLLQSCPWIALLYDSDRGVALQGGEAMLLRRRPGDRPRCRQASLHAVAAFALRGGSCLALRAFWC
jgi:hypothetical protein